MKKFIIVLLLMVVEFFVLDRLGGLFIQQIYLHSKDVYGGKLNYIENKADEEVLLMGNSRTLTGYVPSILSDTLKKTVYNIGITSTYNSLLHYLELKLLLKKHRPKVIVLEVSKFDIYKDSSEINAKEMMPFFGLVYGKDAEIDSVLNAEGYKIPYTLSHIYRGNSRFLVMLLGLLTKEMDSLDNGFKPCAHSPIPLNALSDFLQLQEDKKAQLYLQKFIGLCKEKGVKLILVTSPYYRKATKDYYEPLRKIAKENNLLYLDYNTSGFLQEDPSNFEDLLHMSEKGARKFTERLAHDIKLYLKK